MVTSLESLPVIALRVICCASELASSLPLRAMKPRPASLAR